MRDVEASQVMGTDIDGWIEIATEVTPHVFVWSAVVSVGLLLDRDYDAFGCLFGVTNHAHFQPIAPNRGIPADASEMIQHEIDRLADVPDACLWPTWIVWSEIQAIDWDEETRYPDSRLHRYRRDPNGQLIYETKAAWSADLAQLTGSSFTEVITQPFIWREGQEWQTDTHVFRAEKLRRRDIRTDNWETSFKIMEVLARRFGEHHVRLVVWFNQ
jgi:hypothetical protein